MNIHNLSLKMKQALTIFKEVKNPVSSYLFYMGKSNEINVKTKKIGSFTFNKDQKKLFNVFLTALPYLKKEDEEECKIFFNQYLNNQSVLDLNDYKVIRDECYIFAEKWAQFPYNFKKISEGDIIIDIGANVGDTPLEFASMGLTVYGFEPVKELYDISLKNLNLNPHFENRIYLFNNAVSYKKGTITIDSLGSVGGYIDEEQYDVDVITIDDIIKENNIKPRLLKMDCEGCEFDIIRNSDLSMFDEIIFEHHASFRDENYSDLVDILKKQGFDIDLIPLWSFKMDDVGIIHAYK